MSKYLGERKNFLKNNAIYKKALILSDFKEKIDNSILAETDLDSLSDKPCISSVQSIKKYLKQIPSIDLIEAGDVEFKNINLVKELVDEGRKLICVIKPNANFFSFKYRMNPWLSAEKSIELLSNFLNKDILYYGKGKEIVCYIY